MLNQREKVVPALDKADYTGKKRKKSEAISRDMGVHIESVKAL